MPGAPLGGEIILLVYLMTAVTQRCFPVNLGTIVGEFRIMLSPPIPSSINYSSCRLCGGSSLSCLDVYMCTLSLWGFLENDLIVGPEMTGGPDTWSCGHD